jgi:hypothetical protein
MKTKEARTMNSAQIQTWDINEQIYRNIEARRGIYKWVGRQRKNGGCGLCVALFSVLPILPFFPLFFHTGMDDDGESFLWSVEDEISPGSRGLFSRFLACLSFCESQCTLEICSYHFPSTEK